MTGPLSGRRRCQAGHIYRKTKARSELMKPSTDAWPVETAQRALVEQIVVPIRSGQAWPVLAGQLCRIVTIEGPQVADFNAWNLHNPRERFWAARSRQLQASHVTTFDRLWSTLPYLRPMLTITNDTIQYGVDEDGGRCHDLLGTRCDPYVTKLLMGEEFDFHCHSNLTRAVLPWGLDERDVHDVLNIFQVTGLNEDDRYYMKPSPAQKGRLLRVLRRDRPALRDLNLSGRRSLGAALGSRRRRSAANLPPARRRGLPTGELRYSKIGIRRSHQLSWTAWAGDAVREPGCPICTYPVQACPPDRTLVLYCRRNDEQKGSVPMRPAELRLLYEYGYDRNIKLLDQAQELTDEQFSSEPPFGHDSVRQIFFHIASAERGWRGGWQTGERPERLDRRIISTSTRSAPSSTGTTSRRWPTLTASRKLTSMRSSVRPALADDGPRLQSWHPAPQRDRHAPDPFRPLSRRPGSGVLRGGASGGVGSSE